MADSAQWGKAGLKYKIHEETFHYFQRSQMMEGSKSHDETTLGEMRGEHLRMSEEFGGYVKEFSGSENEIIVPTEEGGIPVSVYKPSQLPPVPPIFVYYHGGGLVIGSRNCYVTTLKTLATRAQCIVVNVEYRLAPEHKAPAPFNDCRDVVQWVMANKTRVGGSVHSAVGIGGDSSGGNLATSVSHRVSGLAFQVLVYPFTDQTLSSPSCAEFTDTPGVNRNGLQWFRSQYLSSDDQKTDPVESPYHHPTFSPRLPPALCILAELDPLRDDGLGYCDKLKAAGVPTDILVVKGAPHGFFSMPAVFKELTKEPYDKCVEFLRRFHKD